MLTAPKGDHRPQHGQPWFGSAKEASGVTGKASSSGGLHAEQHFEYHRHLKPGDVLTVETKPGADSIIGTVTEDPNHFVQMQTRFGGRRMVDWLSGEQLPRIC